MKLKEAIDIVKAIRAGGVKKAERVAEYMISWNVSKWGKGGSNGTYIFRGKHINLLIYLEGAGRKYKLKKAYWKKVIPVVKGLISKLKYSKINEERVTASASDNFRIYANTEIPMFLVKDPQFPDFKGYNLSMGFITFSMGHGSSVEEFNKALHYNGIK